VIDHNLPYHEAELRQANKSPGCVKSQVGGDLAQLDCVNMSISGEFIPIINRILLIGGDENRNFRLFTQPIIQDNGRSGGKNK
jgi:hypothetical protein